MGTDKAFLRLGNVTLIEHVISVAKEVCATVVLVGDKGRLSRYGLVVEDEYPGQGPLAGIHAALSSAFSAPSSIVLSVDIPAISAAFLKYLVNEHRDGRGQITLPRSGGHLQTLCAVYRPEFAAIAEQSLREGRNKIDPLFSRVPVRVIEEEELKALGFSPDIFDNVNTPADWQRIQQRFGIDPQ